MVRNVIDQSESFKVFITGPKGGWLYRLFKIGDSIWGQNNLVGEISNIRDILIDPFHPKYKGLYFEED